MISIYPSPAGNRLWEATPEWTDSFSNFFNVFFLQKIILSILEEENKMICIYSSRGERKVWEATPEWTDFFSRAFFFKLSKYF